MSCMGGARTDISACMPVLTLLSGKTRTLVEMLKWFDAPRRPNIVVRKVATLNRPYTQSTAESRRRPFRRPVASAERTGPLGNTTGAVRRGGWFVSCRRSVWCSIFRRGCSLEMDVDISRHTQGKARNGIGFVDGLPDSGILCVYWLSALGA